MPAHLGKKTFELLKVDKLLLTGESPPPIDFQMCPTKILSTCSKVLEFLQPEVLKSQFDLDFKDKPMSNADLEQLAEKVIKYSVKTGKLNLLLSWLRVFGTALGVWDSLLKPRTGSFEQELCPKFPG